MAHQNILKLFIKRFGKKGENIVSPGITQIHDIETVINIYTSETSREETDD